MSPTTEETIKNQITAQAQLIADATNQTRLHVYKLAVMGYLHHLSAGQTPPVTPVQPFKRNFAGLVPGEVVGWNPTFVDGPELLGSPLATYISGVSGSTAGTTLPDPATLPPNVFAPGTIQPGGSGMSALPNDTIPDGTVVFHNGEQWQKRVTPWGGVYLKVGV